ncbi:hypothetical protein Tco_1454020 [Tanacetum coccineum]
MVKRDFEIETVGDCVDEIDKLAELIGEHEADQHCLHSRSYFVNDVPCISSLIFSQLLIKRRKFVATKRAEEKRNKPPTKAQQRSSMTTYLKNITGWKPKDLHSVLELFLKGKEKK